MAMARTALQQPRWWMNASGCRRPSAPGPSRDHAPLVDPRPLPIKGASEIDHDTHDIGIAGQVAGHSDATEVDPNLRWLLTLARPDFRKLVIFRRTSRAKPRALGHTSSRCRSRPA
jgi:hypothetical protein